MAAVSSNIRAAKRVELRETSLRNSMNELAATMTGIITLSRGDPDMATPAHIVEAGRKALANGATHYVTSAGIKELRTAIAATMTRESGTHYTADEIVVTTGAQEAMACTMLALIDPGDEVIVQAPGYNAYHSSIELAGGIIVPVETDVDHGFALTAAAIEKVLTPRSRMLCLISPNNPTGAVVPPSEIEKIAQLCVAKDLILVSDEIYAKIVYDNHHVLSPASLPGLHERTITINGFSKAYAMTGWRIGWLAAPKSLIPALADLHHTLAICASAASQYAAVAALSEPQDDFDRMLATYAERRRLLMRGLDSLKLSYVAPGGGLYVFAKVTDTGMSLDAFCMKMLKEAKVLLSPGTYYSSKDFVRISLLQPADKISEAIERMRRVLYPA